LPIDLSLVRSIITVLGLAVAAGGRWLSDKGLGVPDRPGLTLVNMTVGRFKRQRALWMMS
jgi:hypothetical protein